MYELLINHKQVGLLEFVTADLWCNFLESAKRLSFTHMLSIFQT